MKLVNFGLIYIFSFTCELGVQKLMGLEMSQAKAAIVGMGFALFWVIENKD